jgi:O-methyltransferase involved in polyketide biosynthesis
MSRGHVRLSPTAYFTAGAWASEGFPNADLFDTTLGRALYGSSHWLLERLGARAPSLPWHEQFLLIRHYAFETRLLAMEPTYVLEVGAGLSPRGITFARAWPQATYVEVDLPHMVRRKRRLLKNRGAPSNYLLAEGDITDPRLLDGLPALPARDDTVAILTEGVLDYLPMADKRRAMSTFVGLLRTVSDGCHLFDSYTQERLSKYPVSAGAILWFMSAVNGSPFRDQLFANAQHAEAFSVEAGYTEARALDVERLNTRRYHPPMGHCHFELFEARVRSG